MEAPGRLPFPIPMLYPVKATDISARPCCVPVPVVDISL